MTAYGKINHADIAALRAGAHEAPVTVPTH